MANAMSETTNFEISLKKRKNYNQNYKKLITV